VRNGPSPDDQNPAPKPGLNTAVPGSAARAFLGWRTTASALLVFWGPLPFMWRLILQGSDPFADLAFVLLAVMIYGAAIFLVIPLFAFTLGRRIDRRTSPLGLRRSVISFGLWGAGFGLIVVLLGGFGLTPLGAALLFLSPTLAAVVGRLLVEVRGRGWAITWWVTFTLAVLVAVALVGTIVVAMANGD